MHRETRSCYVRNAVKVNIYKVAFNCCCFLLVSAAKKNDIERIYEQKNYAYLRPEEMKHLRFVSKPMPEDIDPDTSSDQKSGEKKP